MKKWPEAGIIYCEKEQVACAYCSTEDGTCKRSRCNIHDPEYIARQEEIERTRKANDEKRIKASIAEKKNPPAPIRDDRNKTVNEIKNLERRARYCFTRGWTQRGFELSDRAAALKRASQ